MRRWCDERERFDLYGVVVEAAMPASGTDVPRALTNVLPGVDRNLSPHCGNVWPWPGGREPMRRREFITLLGGAAGAWPVAARAQQTIRRIGVLLPAAADDAEFQTRVGAFLEGLQQSGWTIGQNVQN
jgi:hypothetical protein